MQISSNSAVTSPSLAGISHSRAAVTRADISSLAAPRRSPEVTSSSPLIKAATLQRLRAVDIPHPLLRRLLPPLRLQRRLRHPLNRRFHLTIRDLCLQQSLQMTFHSKCPVGVTT